MSFSKIQSKFPHGPAIILLSTNPKRILSDTGLLQSSGSLLKSKEVCLVEGIVDRSSIQATVQIVNIGESEATIFSGTPVGICESYYEVESTVTVNCAAISRDVTESQLSELLPIFKNYGREAKFN